ncbi:hypothetical protein ACJW30_11G153000 [Castanea mollissima]
MGLQTLHPLQFPKKAMTFKRRSQFLDIFGRNLSVGYVQIRMYNANNLLSSLGQTIQNFLVISLDASIKLILFYFFQFKETKKYKTGKKKLHYYNFMHLLSCQTKVVVKLILRPLLLKCNPYVKLEVQKISIKVVK